MSQREPLDLSLDTVEGSESPLSQVRRGEAKGGIGSTDGQRAGCVGPVGDRQSSRPLAAPSPGHH